MNPAIKQIALGDRLIVNKIDLVSVQDVQNVQKIISQINPTAEIFITQHSNVNIDQFLHIGAFHAKNLLGLEHVEHNHIQNALVHAPHDLDVLPISIFSDKPVLFTKLEAWLGDLLWEQDDNRTVLRCKGVVYPIVEKDIGEKSVLVVATEKYMLQGVNSIFEVKNVGIEWGTEKPYNKLVFIGKNLNQKEIQESFNKLT